MKYIKKDGTNKHLIIMLHGSRTKLSSLLEKVNTIDPDATVIGFQGEKKERGATRYFSRHVEGHYDLESLAEATVDFNESLKSVMDKYKLKNFMISVLGYSNGANLIENFLREYNAVLFDNVILLHPASINPGKEFKTQSDLNVLLTSGENDSFLNKEQFKQLSDRLTEASINLETFIHEGGHEMIQEEFDIAKEFVLRMNDNNLIN